MIVASTTSNDVRSGPNDKHVTASHGVTARHGTVTVSQHVTERRDVTGYQSRAEQNPLTPTWDAPALKRPFLGIRSASIHGASSMLWISASATSGEWPRMVDHWSLGISLVLRPTAVRQGTQLFDQPGVVRARAKAEGRLRSRVSGAAASRGLVTHVARPGDCAKSDTPSLGHGTESSNPDTALRRERQPLGIDRPDLGMLQDFAKVHEMPLRGGSRGTAGASPDANGRLDNRIPTDSRLSIFPDAGKTGTDGENLSYSTSRERQDCYHVGNERGSVSEHRRLADSRPPAHP